MDKYTPGPWTVDVHKNILHEGRMLAFPCISGGHPQEANACLIAAAPDLMAALVRLSAQAARLRLPGQPMSDAEKAALAAIAKATGATEA